MNRAMACVLSVVLASLLASPASGSSVVRTERHAYAQFELKSRRGTTPFIGVSIREVTSSEGTTASFSIMKGFCLEGSTTLDECAVTSDGFISGALKPDEYEMDPLMRRASLKVTRKGFTHEVAWTATTPAQPVAYERYCESGDRWVVAGSGFNASAEGTVFGKARVSERSKLDSFASATTCTD